MWETGKKCSYFTLSLFLLYLKVAHEIILFIKDKDQNPQTIGFYTN